MRRGMPPGAIELSYLEKKVLLALAKVPKASPDEIRAAGKFRELVEVMNAASWLQAKGLVTMKERVVHSYRLARPEVARRQLPERKALKAAIKVGGRIEVGRLRAACKFDDADLAVALGWLRRKGWAEVSKGPTGSFVVVTNEGRAAANANLLRSGKWRSVDFRRYDTKAFAPLIRPGKRHVLGAYIERIRRIFLSMGFTEIQGDFVLSAFWNFDALFQPQDHPARDQLDTFYLSKPSTMPLPDEGIVRAVAEAHETGGATGSTGWRYPWDRKEAERAVLRSHTTPITLKWLGEHPDPPQKAFIIGRVFRPEVTEPMGLKAPVLAWGLGLERLIMAVEGISDIRQLYLSDLDWLRDHRAVL